MGSIPVCFTECDNSFADQGTYDLSSMFLIKHWGVLLRIYFCSLLFLCRFWLPIALQFWLNRFHPLNDVFRSWTTSCVHLKMGKNCGSNIMCCFLFMVRTHPFNRSKHSDWSIFYFVSKFPAVSFIQLALCCISKEMWLCLILSWKSGSLFH